MKAKSTRARLSRAQFEIMNVVWELGKAGATDVLDALDCDLVTVMGSRTVVPDGAARSSGTSSTPPSPGRPTAWCWPSWTATTCRGMKSTGFAP